MLSTQQLAETAKDLVAIDKGILAADESSATIKKRFDSIGVESTEENRRDYRELLFTTEGCEKYISGVIMYDETMRQSSADGKPLTSVLTEKGIIPGVKVDIGAKTLAGSPEEKITEGLDGLRERLAEYATLGARFTKWRAVIEIGQGIPTDYCVRVNAQALGRFASLSQEKGLVPIVEPEVLMDGEHDIKACFNVTENTLREVYYELGRQGVNLEGSLLKPNMVLSGKDASSRVDSNEVGKWTMDCFRRTVPASVPGIVFLSGGQSDEEATVNLDAINRRAVEVGAPWELSFSYGRGLQSSPLKAWGGKKANVNIAQRAFYNRARLTSAARNGAYDVTMSNVIV